jgi:hypothetical protein
VSRAPRCHGALICPGTRPRPRLHRLTAGPRAPIDAGASCGPASLAMSLCVSAASSAACSRRRRRCTTASRYPKAAENTIGTISRASAAVAKAKHTAPDRRSGSILAPVCHCRGRIIRGVRNDSDGGYLVGFGRVRRTPRGPCAHASAVQNLRLLLRVHENGQCTKVGCASCPAWYRAA